jgi:hypothetical protein
MMSCSRSPAPITIRPKSPSTPQGKKKIASKEAAVDNSPTRKEEEESNVVTKERKTPGVSVRMTLLPEDFEPGEHDVLCGRGGICKNWSGNVSYRRLVRSKLQEYSLADTKHLKGVILDSIVKEVRKKSGRGGGFIKKDDATNRWCEVGDFLAREKTSQCFRDALHDQYTSSAHAKYKRRKLEHAEDGGSDKKKAKGLPSLDESNPGSTSKGHQGSGVSSTQCCSVLLSRG